VKLVYSPQYAVDVADHPFNTSKYRLIKERLIDAGIFADEAFVEPEPATDDDIRLVHTADWVRKLKDGTLSDDELNRLEIAYSPELVKACWLWAGGSILAGRLALSDGACYHDGGGFHHAFPDHGEGFCAINDHCVAVRRLLADEAIETAIIVDCDCHQANGTAAIFAADPNVLTLSIHQENNYPFEKPPSDVDIGLADGTGDETYLDQLAHGLEFALNMWKPDLMFYVAGADTYRYDQLGGLGLTVDGMKRRDELVCGTALENEIPLATVLAGGYAADVQDLVTIHANTAMVMKDMLG
jgi:acetoin utilization deacetylase AcuC-like enzyme